jgi:hypothetical protein
MRALRRLAPLLTATLCACAGSAAPPITGLPDHPVDVAYAGPTVPDAEAPDAAARAPDTGTVVDVATGTPEDTASSPADHPPSAVGHSILFVVGTNNGSVAAGQGIGDKVVRARLEGQGHRLTLAADTMAAGPLLQAASAAELVLVSESVSSANLQGKLKTTPAPILSYEAFIQDEMGLTPPGPPGDPGLPANFALGVKMMDTKIDIVDPAHPLAAGLSGTVTVYLEPREVTWGKVAPTAEVVATLAGDPAGVCIYVYRKGAKLYDGTLAAGMRVGIFLEDDDKVGTPNVLTVEGLRLFDTAVAFTAAGGR